MMFGSTSNWEKYGPYVIALVALVGVIVSASVARRDRRAADRRMNQDREESTKASQQRGWVDLCVRVAERRVDRIEAHTMAIAATARSFMYALKIYAQRRELDAGLSSNLGRPEELPDETEALRGVHNHWLEMFVLVRNSDVISLAFAKRTHELGERFAEVFEMAANLKKEDLTEKGALVEPEEYRKLGAALQEFSTGTRDVCNELIRNGAEGRLPDG